MPLALADTASMPVWNSEKDAPNGFYIWGSYTELGPFKPRWDVNNTVPYAVRRDHKGRHNPKARWGHLRKLAKTVWREVGDYFVGAFQPVRGLA